MTADVSNDPYEQKLYHMFTSHDGASVGSLDAGSLRRLCKTLDLKDRESLLVDACLRNAQDGRVTFKGFKDGLLTLLGDASGSGGRTVDVTSNSDNLETRNASTPISGQSMDKHSLPSREVSPKFVVAGKKYGRRTRPVSCTLDGMSTESDDDNSDANDKSNCVEQRTPSKCLHKVQRSSSHSELHDEPRRRYPVISGTSTLKRCASLPAQAKPFKRDAAVDAMSQSAGAPLLRDSSVESLGEWPTESSAVPAEVIVDMWDTAGIPNPRSLLDTLGFSSKEIRISQLSLAIEDDLQTLPVASTDINAAHTLLRASLALHKSEVNALQLAFRQIAAHNRQLHASNRDTNRRAALLAHEVDERHSHLENQSKNEIRQQEHRHAEIVRVMTEQMAAEREQMTAYISKLEKRNKTLESDDARLRLQCELCVEENSGLEADLISVQRQCAELLEENIRLNNTLSDVDERQRADESRKDDRESEELLELMEKVSSLQMENANLRDKNDELCTEVEEQLVELSKLRVSTKKSMSATDTIISATKRRGDSPSKTKLSEESPKLGKLRKCSNDSDDSAAAAGMAADQSDCSGEWMALHAELGQSSAVVVGATTKESAGALLERIRELEERLRKASDATANGQRIAELEASLEQMRKEFDLLEDYWQGKMNEERDRFDGEHQKSHETIDGLQKKLADYEEQFVANMEKAARNRLSPIAERDILEQQYVDLEDELEMERDQNRQVLEAKDAEVSVLQRKCSELESRLVEFMQNQQAAAFMPGISMNGAGDGGSLHGGTISCRSVDGDNSPASSPISYLLTQSTIQAPARDYQNPNWGGRSTFSSTTIGAAGTDALNGDTRSLSSPANVTPIRRPGTPSQHGSRGSSVHSDAIAGAAEEHRRETGSDTSSVHSYSATSVQSNSITNDVNSSTNLMRDEVKKLKFVEINLRNEVQALIVHRNQITNDIQQLQAMERTAAYTRSNHPTLMQRNYALEQRVRSLEMCLKNQHQYSENIIQRTSIQHNNMISALHSRLEEQQVLINEQAARLVNNDIFAKDMFVENSQLGDLLEQQRMCNTRLRQHHQQI